MVSIHVALPMRQQKQAASGWTILQIEDNPANADVVTQMISRRSDLKLQTATDGPQGIEMACALLPDVILLDMRMPGMSGLDVIPVLRRDSATAQIPVIALSSNTYPSEVRKCQEAGVFRYLTKPYRLEDLMAAIDAALQHAAQSHPPMEARISSTRATRSSCPDATQPTPSGAVDRIRP